MVKKLPANSGDARQMGLIPGLGRSPVEGTGNPLQYFCLGNPMDRGAQQAMVHGVAKSWTRLSEQMEGPFPLEERGRLSQEVKGLCR